MTRKSVIITLCIFVRRFLEDLRYSQTSDLNIGNNSGVKRIGSHVVKPLTQAAGSIAHECG
jgi:hypothetical protein